MPWDMHGPYLVFPNASKLRGGVGFVLLNFAAPIAFFWTNRLAGPKPAIALALVITAAQVLAHRILRKKFSPFFIVASAFTFLFGGTDLLLEDPTFFRFQPFAQNVLIATILALTLARKVPVMEWFARSLPPSVRPETSTSEGIAYLKKLGWVWVAYLYAKAGLFFFLAHRVDLGELVLLRSVIGGASLVLMIGGEIAYRKFTERRRKELPHSGQSG